jgi:hypothetical protein
MDGLKPGRVVYYQDVEDVVTPGIVTRVHDAERGLINIATFPDKADEPSEVVERKTSVLFDGSEKPAAGTWHWMFDGQQKRYDATVPH